MDRSERKANLTNDRAVRALKWQVGDPKQFEIKDQDHPGFYIRLCNGGAKTWLYRFMIRGKLRRLNLGRFPFVDCVEAFKQYNDARTQVTGGIDVFELAAETKYLELSNEQSNSLLLSTLFHNHFYPRYCAQKKSKKNDWHYFTVKIEPFLGSKAATNITPEDIERLIRPMEVVGFNTARLTLALLRKMFNWAVEPASSEISGEGSVLTTGHTNPCRHYRFNSINKPKPVDRYLRVEEIRRLWAKLGNDSASRIIKLQLLTGCRVGEVCGMEWSEIDLESKEWLMPRERVKTDRPHLIPLSDTMLSILGLPSVGKVFKSKSQCGHTTNYVVNQRLKRICETLSIKNVSTHTMRRTFITQLARLGISVELRNRLTNHADSSVDGIYNQHDYYSQKSEALAIWDQEILRICNPKDK